MSAKQTKKPTAKKTTAKPKAKPAAKKTTATTKQKPETVQAKLTPVKTKPPATKRPPLTPSILHQVIDSDLTSAKANLDAYAAHLRALDRKRLNNIGNKREGFTQRAYRIAMDNPEFLPNYLSPEKYTEDYDHYMILQTAVVLEEQVHELLKNINTECMDYFYTDALDFYAAVREAAKRRVDTAESLYEELKTSFDRKKGESAGGTPPQTEKQQLRKAKGIITGKIDGKIEAVNIKPKAAGGVHKVVDEQFKDTGRFKETEEGEIDE